MVTGTETVEKAVDILVDDYRTRCLWFLRADYYPATREETDQVFFGATVTYATADGTENTVRIVGIDETDPSKHYVSWISPVARALIKAREGDTVRLRTPGGDEELEILDVRYEAIPMPPFEPIKSTWTPNAR